jgi:hypothetical protein
MFDTRGVSRERIIGISFVDILIQAVFLLLLILIVGYVDPIESLKIKEYEDIGKDLCVKIKKDSPKACREYVENTKIGPVGNNEFGKIGSEVCKKLGKSSAKDCSDALDKVYSLWPCIESKDGVRSPWIARWEINTLTSAKFLGFSDEYLKHLKTQEDTKRIAMVKALEPMRGSQMSALEIEEKFGFVREKFCFHEVLESRSIAVTDQQIASIRSAIYNLRKITGN